MAADEGKAAGPPVRYFAYPSSDGIALLGKEWGDPNAAMTVLLLHGLTRTSRDFDALVAALVADTDHPLRVVAIDYRGRGGSGHAPWPTYTPLQEAQDILAGVDHLGLSRAVVLGTSRGGLVMFVLAFLRPSLFAAAIFNDIGPVVGASGATRIAAYVGSPLRETWPEAIAALKAGQGFMFTGLDDAGWERYARQIHADADGKPCLSYDAALKETFRTFDASAPQPNMWPGFDALAHVPVMVVHGGLSDVLLPETVAEMAEHRPDIVIHEVPDEGHPPLLWDAASQQAILSFIRSVK